MSEVFVVIYYILFILTFLFGMYFAVTGLFGFKNYHKSMFGRHKPKHKFGIIIAGRNEDGTINEELKVHIDQAHPINKETREMFNTTILGAFERAKTEEFTEEF